MDSIENNYALYTLDGGILYIRYHADIVIKYEGAVKIVADRLRFQQGICYPALCDITGVEEVDKPARDYLASEGSILLKAVAFIVGNPMSNIISYFYLKTTKPSIPTKAFQDVEEAKLFLEKYI
ncbi:MAG: hypothetical protein COA40_08175 [Aequorivita sp.]|jgi:hypothetical protein|nr:MAG: hypothetical protein COA40_08175 [Aequorivita sp.]